jgi:hypothetical protein
MSMSEISQQLTERKNGQRSAAMDEQIARETRGKDVGAQARNPPSQGVNSAVIEVLEKTCTRLDELSARIAEIERHIASQRPDAERFAHEIGPIALATRNLREEILGHKDEMKKGLDAHRKEAAATLKQIEGQIGQHRVNIQNDISQVNALVGASGQMVKEGKSLLQQSMTIYTKATQNITDVSLRAAKHVETTAQNAGKFLDEQTARLKRDLKALEEMYYRMRDWLFAKTIAVGLTSAIVGAMMGGLVVTLYTMRRIDAVAEVERNSAKWQYLIEQQNKKSPQSGAEFNRQIEQELENREKGEAQDANK